MPIKKINTNDGSISYFNDSVGDTYHSTSGALEEAFEKYAIPCRLKDGMTILDICFGLGYNSLAALCLAKVNIIALENDKAILDEIQHNTIFENKEIKKQFPVSLGNINKNYGKIKIAAKDHYFSDTDGSIRIVVGDARLSIQKIQNNIDAVFLDPFAPKKAPELWSKEFFDDIFSVMKKDGVLATYSCASQVRKNLIKAGFNVQDGPSIGRRSPSTLAYKPIS